MLELPYCMFQIVVSGMLNFWQWNQLLLQSSYMYCISIFHLTFPVPQFLLQNSDVEFQASESFEILTKRLFFFFFLIEKSKIVLSGRTSRGKRAFCKMTV